MEGQIDVNEELACCISCYRWTIVVKHTCIINWALCGIDTFISYMKPSYHLMYLRLIVCHRWVLVHSVCCCFVLLSNVIDPGCRCIWVHLHIVGNGTGCSQCSRRYVFKGERVYLIELVSLWYDSEPLPELRKPWVNIDCIYLTDDWLVGSAKKISSTNTNPFLSIHCAWPCWY